ncbi:SDR family NAD(P)-dependent oxidoreductase [Algoriphagus boritolerans]|uniref:NAD(P)-dependent dehydrogenase, short-chain alcohol dehydrogenase family n=1 Tax=Algoriphagus boritolerans DSM 17298 = JCM 18970 TaxID=1120964 RepID=A0A1H5WM98_9BACT|nr:SDR family oxidoreductase [Algoriphagus boritolerans]SEG00453.1 NAD(P)-dependent dehydrogenase, short-chain alcohol dehydrogenase family [Algoriphagus boritolerans DSM 17298 = JCM 18970]
MKDKNIVIVGGNSGIGAATAALLGDAGANLFLYSKSGNLTTQLDTSVDFSEIPGLPDVIDGVVYCPGTINLKPFHRISIADFQNELEVNFFGAVRVLQACLKGLKKSSSPAVVLYSTVAVQTGMGFHAGIASAKGAVEGLTRSLAAEWAPSKIRVNAIAPSLTETPLASALLSTPERKEASDKRHPLGRIGTSGDIAEATVFLLSPKSSWMTGQILHIDGGMSNLK